jgi:hypothetical protein
MSRSDEARLETAISEALAARERNDSPGVGMTVLATLGRNGTTLKLPVVRNGFMTSNEVAARRILEEDHGTVELLVSKILRLAELLPTTCLDHGTEVTFSEFVSAIRATGVTS